MTKKRTFSKALCQEFWIQGGSEGMKVKALIRDLKNLIEAFYRRTGIINSPPPTSLG